MISFFYRCTSDNRRPTKVNGPRNRVVNIVSRKGRATLYQERTRAALRIPSNEERLTLNDVHPVHGRAATRGKRAAWTYTGYTRAYGVLTSKAFAVDATAVRRAATENNFIATLYDGGVRRVGGRQILSGLQSRSSIYLFTTPANLRSDSTRDP